MDEKQKSILITDDGYEAAEDVLGVRRPLRQRHLRNIRGTISWMQRISRGRRSPATAAPRRVCSSEGFLSQLGGVHACALTPAVIGNSLYRSLPLFPLLGLTQQRSCRREVLLPSLRQQAAQARPAGQQTAPAALLCGSRLLTVTAWGAAVDFAEADLPDPSFFLLSGCDPQDLRSC